MSLAWCDPCGFSIPALWDQWQVGAEQLLFPNFLSAGILGALILCGAAPALLLGG